jgi:translation initiation factor 1A
MVAKKSSKNVNKGKKNDSSTVNKPLIYKGDMQQYGKITKLLGDRRVMLVTPDNSEILGHIQGKFRKRVWFSVNDIVLFSRRDFQDEKVDIIHKYSEDDIKKLIKDLEIPPNFTDENFGETTTYNDIGINIDDAEDEDEDIDLDEI